MHITGTCSRVHTHAHIRGHAHGCTQAHIRGDAHRCTHTHIFGVRSWAYTCIYSRKSSCVHTHAYSGSGHGRTHAYIRGKAHACTHAQIRGRCSWWHSTPTPTHSLPHSLTHIVMHTRTHGCTRTRTHAHTLARTHRNFLKMFVSFCYRLLKVGQVLEGTCGKGREGHKYAYHSITMHAGATATYAPTYLQRLPYLLLMLYM